MQADDIILNSFIPAILVIFISGLVFGIILLAAHFTIEEFDRLRMVVYRASLDIIASWKAAHEARLDVNERSRLIAFNDEQLEQKILWSIEARKMIVAQRERSR